MQSNIIAKNKLNTVLIMALFVIIIGAISLIISYFWGGMNVAIGGIVFATLYALLQYFLASKIAVLSTGAKEIQKSDNPRLYEIVQKLSQKADLPMPKVYMITDPAPNAFATGRSPKDALVCATTGLLDIMNDDELEAVMAHEMSHVKNYDIRVAMIAFGLASVVGVLSNIAGQTIINNGRRNENGGLQVVLGVLVIILAPILALIIQMAVSRSREFLADASASEIMGRPDNMISALQQLRKHNKPMQKQDSATAMLFISNPLKKGGIVARLFSTHPPLEERIMALEDAQHEF
ncbi:MAG: M48 family metalloprotease [Candidatus Nomurabacteria bacterium]|jgi:heat shock protein HtpX|nr:M48 family metalloprotease [Candidatus Nomurabacteria bacterium]